MQIQEVFYLCLVSEGSVFGAAAYLVTPKLSL